LLELHVALKLVMVAPLFAPGANDTLSGPVVVVVDPETAPTPMGGAGVPTVTAFDALDSAPTPIAFFAATLNV
jgi:hypothetical protein